LPYNKAEGTKGITVETITVALDVSPSPPWTAGQTVTLVATVTRDTTPWAGALVLFDVLIYLPPTVAYRIGQATTGTDGKATLTFTIPWKADTNVLPCHTIGFRAIENSTLTSSPIKTGACAFPTRISITAPDRVVPGASFTISGKLEYESNSGVWSPLAGRTVSLYYNTTKITDVTTGSDGSYSASASIPSSGTYMLKASYAGEGFALASALAQIKLAVPESVKPLITPLAAILVGGIVAIASTRKR